MTEEKQAIKTVVKSIVKEEVKEAKAEIKTETKEPTLIELINAQKATESVMVRRETDPIAIKHKPITPANIDIINKK
jgi:hypothetical protein